MDASAALPPPPDPAPYVYAATDLAPRQSREIELCERASHFDWQYAGAFGLAFAGSVLLDIGPLKQSGSPGVRLIGPGIVGFSTGGFLAGGYLSLPKCDPQWAEGAPPEGNIRVTWPIATSITLISAVLAPILDYVFLGPVPFYWPVPERSIRVGIGVASGTLGAIVPWILPPRTWSAAKEIYRLRVEGMPGGAQLSYTTRF